MLGLLTCGALLLAWQSLFARDTRPPRLHTTLHASSAEGVEPLAAASSYPLPSQQPLALRVRSSEPVKLTVRYGSVHQEYTGRWHRLELAVQPGSLPLELIAEDRAGNRSSLQYTIVGVPPLQPLLQIPDAISPGEAFMVQLAPPAPLYGMDVQQDISLSLNGQPLQLFDASESLVALAALPLNYEGEHVLPDAVLELQWRDRFARSGSSQHPVIVVPNNRRLETLSLSEPLRNIRNDENLFYEQALIEDAYRSYDLPEPLWRQPFVQPIEGLTSSGYGVPRRYGVGGSVAFHSGTDIAAPEGTPIVATNDGIVVIASPDYPIRGTFTMLAHGAGVYSLYYHQASLQVRPGDRVQRGQVIGTVGNTGLSTGAHLHWEMHVGGVATQPEPWVGALLPGL